MDNAPAEIVVGPPVEMLVLVEVVFPVGVAPTMVVFVDPPGPDPASIKEHV